MRAVTRATPALHAGFERLRRCGVGGLLSAWGALSRFQVAVAASFLAYVVIFVLSQARALHVTDTGLQDTWPWLGAIAWLLTPAGVTSAQWRGAAGLSHIIAFGITALGLVGLWAWMLWLVRPGKLVVPLRTVIGAVLLVSVPLLLLIGLFSDDLYLYAFYGRILSKYGSNPYLYTPDMFWGDPHLEKVFWTWLPASYGPLWLLLSGGLSWLAGEQVVHSVLLYKGAMLVAHVLTTVVIAYVLRRQRAPWATWGAVFYGLNPLVLFEAVGNGHNDALVALLVALGVAAVIRGWAHVGVAALAAGAMVKAPAVLLLAPVAAAVVFRRAGLRRQVVAAISLGVVALGTALVLYKPLWAGDLLLVNIRWNPASWEVNNSLWELSRRLGGDFNRMLSDNERHVAAGLALLTVSSALVRIRRGREWLPTVAAMWFAYVVSLNWVWPWYFLSAFPLVAMAGPGRVAVLYSAVSVGGLLFWMGWSDPAHPWAPWIYEFRSVLLVGPALLTVAGFGGVTLARAWRARRRPEWFPPQRPASEWVPLDNMVEEA